MDRLHTFIDRTLPIKIGYLLLILFLREGVSFVLPGIVPAIVAFMAISALSLAFYFEKYPASAETIINAFFFYTLFDLFLLTMVIHFLGGVEFIYYTFYIILGFVFFTRRQAIFLTTWIVVLFVGVVSLKYLQIIPDYHFILPREQGLHDFLYVFTTTATYGLSLCFLGFLSYGFYKMTAKRIGLLREAQEMLEKEKGSLEIRVRARAGELELERKTLGKKVKERKKELEEERKRLEERAEELERFQKVVAGRELKMEELKKELSQLKKRLKS